MIILFKEFNIPRYYLVAVIGLVLIIAGFVVSRMKPGEDTSKRGI